MSLALERTQNPRLHDTSDPSLNLSLPNLHFSFPSLARTSYVHALFSYLTLSEFGVVHLALQLFVFRDLSRCLHEVFLNHIVSVGSDGEQTGFCANIAQVGTVESITQFAHRFVVDVPALGDRAGVDLENFHSGDFVRQGDLHLSVESARSHECGIQHVGSVGCHDQFDLPEFVEAVHLIEQLHKCSLDFSVGRCALRETFAPNGINLVNKNDARLVLTSVREHLSDDPCGLSDVLVHNS
mmetsp:Transcript_28396/g.55588  ORF Transcript_28396/g.55588 Transcript_28396/m.55588 type:complete len:240 (+) Transcript_28396:153-872(+)